MQKKWIFIFIFMIVISIPMFATPVKWTGNNHYYEAVLSTVTWHTAKAAAESAGGYLATITSEAENSFVYSLISSSPFWFIDGAGNSQGPWLGAYQPSGSPEPLGGWTWVTGEAFSWSNWASGEPNNYNSAEHYLQFFENGTVMAPKWNDIPYDSPVRGYIIEYNVLIPEVSSHILLGLSLGILFFVWKSRNL